MTRVSVNPARRGARNAAVALIGGLAAAMLAGCSSNGTGGDAAATAALAPAPQQQQQQQTKPVTFAPVIGAPAKVSTKLNELLVAQAGQKAMPVVPPKDAEYTIRGYLVAAPDPRGTKLSYIWDVSDKANKRKRFQGEELIEGKKGGDPWSVVDEAAMQKVAAKAIEDISAYLPKGDFGPAPAGAGGGGNAPALSTAPTSAPIAPAGGGGSASSGPSFSSLFGGGSSASSEPAPAPAAESSGGGGFSFSSLFGGGNSASSEPAPEPSSAPASLAPSQTASSAPAPAAPAPVQVASLSNDAPAPRPRPASAAEPQPRAAAAQPSYTSATRASASTSSSSTGGPVLAAAAQASEPAAAPAPRPAPAPQAVASAEAVAVVPAVSGAPGDGGQSLTAAMRKHLQSAGVKLVDRPSGPNVYTVKGSVELGGAENGQQAIVIQWTVVDPSGKPLDKAVVQKNKVAEGSLDGPWGQIADMAAGEAAKSVAKLITKPAG